MKSRKGLILVFALSLIFCLFPLPSAALNIDQIPNPIQLNRGWISDTANLIDPATEKQLNQEINDLEKRTSAELAIVTVDTAKNSADNYATDLFNFWRIGKRDQNNGVLFLIAKSDRRTVIRTGIGLKNTFPDSLAKQIIDTEIIPQFKRQNYQVGIVAGTRSIIAGLSGNKSENIGGNRISQSSGFSSSTNKLNDDLPGLSGFGGGILLFFGSLVAAIKIAAKPILLNPKGFTDSINSDGNLEHLSQQNRFKKIAWGSCFGIIFAIGSISLTTFMGGTIVVVFTAAIIALILAFPVSWLVFRFLRKFTKYQCQTCNSPMQSLKNFDSLMRPEEKAARKLGSRRYEVWYCANCSNLSQRQNVHFWAHRLKSQHQNCNVCKEYTAVESSKVNFQATYNNEGERSHTIRCTYCSNETSWTSIIPMLIESDDNSSSSYSSSDSSSDFGGGSSDGGGSSSDW
jgi:uncharacterized protein